MYCLVSMSFLKKNFISFANKLGSCHVKNYTTNKTVANERYINIVQDKGVKTITLCHSSTRNSLSLEMMKTILWNLRRDNEDESLRSIVITAEPGKIFSAGHNLKELTIEQGEEHHREVFHTAAKLMKVLKESPVPVIAAVDGLAAAAGCQLVCACDIVVCTERSTFSTPGANFGIFCSTPGIQLGRNVPKKIASHMLFTGLPINAQEAYSSGLVSKVVANDKLADEVKIITDAINTKSRSVVALGKVFLDEQLNLEISLAYKLGTDVMVKNLGLKDAQEGIRSFIEKRKPVWKNTFETEE